MRSASTGSPEGSRLFRTIASSRRNASAGFTLIEVLVALAVVSVSLAAIGSLIAVTRRGVRSIGLHRTLVESARAVMTALDARDELVPRDVSSQLSAGRRRVHVLRVYVYFIVR